LDRWLLVAGLGGNFGLEYGLDGLRMMLCNGRCGEGASEFGIIVANKKRVNATSEWWMG
jgi:hypothetical protein